MRFQDAVARFREDFDPPDDRADEVFALAHPMAVETEGKGVSLDEAYDTVTATEQPTVADALKAAKAEPEFELTPPPEREPEAEAQTAETVPRGPRRRISAMLDMSGGGQGSALEGALSAKAQAALGDWFKSYTKSWELRHIREAMEVYERLLEMDTDEARAAMAEMVKATDAFFLDESNENMHALDAAAYTGLQVYTGQEDPDWNELHERAVFATTREQGHLVFNTLDPKTASFDIEEWNTAFGEAEFRRDPNTDPLFPDPPSAVNLWEGRPHRPKKTARWSG